MIKILNFFVYNVCLKYNGKHQLPCHWYHCCLRYGYSQVQLTGTYDFAVAADRVFTYEVEPSSFADFFIVMNAPVDASQNNEFLLCRSGKRTLLAAVTYGIASDTDVPQQSVYAPFDAGHNKLEDYIKNWAQTSINESLNSDGLGAFLSAEEIKDLTFDNFVMACSDSVDALWISLRSKLPELAYQYKNDEFWLRDSSGDAYDPIVLPLQEGDTITFRFVVSTSFDITPEFINAPGDLTEDTEPSLSTTAYTIPGNKQIDIVLHFASNGQVTTAVDNEAPRAPTYY